METPLETVRLGRRLRLPRLRAATTSCVALRQPDEYPIDEGRIVSSRGPRHRRRASTTTTSSRSTVPHSNALCTPRLRGRGAYLAGPLARYSLNFDRLSPAAGEARRAARARARPCRNPFRSIVVRAVEIALRLRRGAADHRRRTSRPSRPAVDVEPRAGRRLRRDRGARAACSTTATSSTTTGRSSTRQDRPADVAEPGGDRGGPARASSQAGRRPAGRRARAARASRRSATTTRASPARPTSSRSMSSAPEPRVVVVGSATRRAATTRPASIAARLIRAALPGARCSRVRGGADRLARRVVRRRRRLGRRRRLVGRPDRDRFPSDERRRRSASCRALSPLHARVRRGRKRSSSLARSTSCPRGSCSLESRVRRSARARPCPPPWRMLPGRSPMPCWERSRSARAGGDEPPAGGDRRGCSRRERISGDRHPREARCAFTLHARALSRALRGLVSRHGRGGCRGRRDARHRSNGA